MKSSECNGTSLIKLLLFKVENDCKPQCPKHFKCLGWGRVTKIGFYFIFFWSILIPKTFLIHATLNFTGIQISSALIVQYIDLSTFLAFCANRNGPSRVNSLSLGSDFGFWTSLDVHEIEPAVSALYIMLHGKSGIICPENDLK